jgi:hypothetical protein
MKNTKKIALITLVPALLIALSFGINKANSDAAKPEESTANQISSTSASQYFTVKAVLSHFTSLTEFEKSPMFRDLSDATVIIYDAADEEEDGGWMMFPPEATGESKVTDMKTGAVIDSYSAKEPRGATLREIKDALAARDKG